MYARRRSRSASCAFVLALLVAAADAAAQERTASVDLDALAQRLVTQNAGIRQGEIVLISGGVRDLELLENLAVHVRKVGAYPLLSIGSERMNRRMWDDVPAELDSQAPALGLRLAEMVDAVIEVPYGETPGMLRHIPVERFAARAAAAEPVTRRYRERNVRFVEVGNNLYPTAALSQRWGVPQAELARIFWSAIDTDYAQLQQIGGRVRAMLESGRELRITHPNGTDLRMRIEGRPIFVSDGVISEEDRQRGSAATSVWLPAGEVYFAPVPGTAQGRLVIDRHHFEGQPVEGLTLAFSNGKLSSMTARSGIERMRALYDAAAAGKDEFAFVDLGINPEVRIPEGSTMVAWVPAGMVTLGIGENTWAGGSNATQYGMAFHLPGATVRVDRTVLVENGVLRP